MYLMYLMYCLVCHLCILGDQFEEAKQLKKAVQEYLKVIYSQMMATDIFFLLYLW